MLVFGDRERREDVEDKLGRINAMLAHAGSAHPGVTRHATLVGALIEAGELVQGIADADMEAAGRDVGSVAASRAMTVLVQLAEAVCVSWRSSFRLMPSLPGPHGLDAVAREHRGTITTRRAEGFAYYALYPEAYLCAAEQATLPSDVRVVGLRSIGTTLAAMVSAASGAPEPVTLRPTGDPFGRVLAMDEDLDRRLLAGTPHLAIVDEGPGLSGSSIGAMMDLATARGLPLERIHVFPGHAGPPGPEASHHHRALWAEVRRHVVSFETLLLEGESPRRLQSWAEDMLGAPTGPMLDISGGRWRALRVEPGPAAPQSERRKFLFPAGEATWLLKFVGLGAFGQAQAQRAELLSQAGFTPPVAGLRHGFLIERWLSDARPLALAPERRSAFICHLGNYLGFRSRSLSAGSNEGAPLRELWTMASANAGTIIGPKLEEWLPHLSALQALCRPVWTDGRLHRWEWLELPGGRLLKADAIDHAAAHDLVGCQDIAWDVAGATCEFELSEREQESLCRAIEAETGHRVERTLVRFYDVAYPAFQLGSFTMAANSNYGEADKLLAEAERYRAALARRR